jgi:hypothetical protein
MATGEAVDCSGVTLGPVDCVQAIVLHAGFPDRLNDGQVGLAATLRAAKGLAAGLLQGQREDKPVRQVVRSIPHPRERYGLDQRGVGQAERASYGRPTSPFARSASATATTCLAPCEMSLA